MSQIKDMRLLLDLPDTIAELSVNMQDYSGYRLSDGIMTRFTAERAVLNNFSLIGMSIDHFDIVSSDCLNLELYDLSVVSASFHSVNMNKTQMHRSSFKNLTIKNSYAHNMNVTDSIFKNTFFIDNEMVGVKFNKCIFLHCTFTGFQENLMYGIQKCEFNECLFIDCSINDEIKSINSFLNTRFIEKKRLL